MCNFSFYNDRVSASSLPSELHKKLQERGLISADGNHLVSFCGMLADSNGINIFLPRSSEIANYSHKSRIKIASQLLKSIERYSRISSTSVDSLDLGDGVTIGSQQLTLIKTLLIDYRNYGLYSRRQPFGTINSGKPNWVRTFANSTPYPNFRNQPVFLEIFGTKRRYFTNSEVSKIHALAIRKLDAKYSWLLDDLEPSSLSELKDIAPPQGDTKHQISILQRELALTYSEREINLLKQLSQVLNETSGDLYSDFVVGLQDFHHAWEYMLKNILQYTVNLNSMLPAPVYVYHDDSNQNAFERGMRADIFLMPPKVNELKIIDAKYYSAKSVESSPGWSDLVKQFFYAKALRTAFPKHNVSNAFIFPGKKGVFKQIRMKSRVNKTNYKFEDETFPPIDCYYLCPLFVIESFANGGSVSLEVLGFKSDQDSIQELSLN